MKTMLCFIAILFSVHSVSAERIAMSLKEAKNWPNTALLDSVVVSFGAKGHQLEFRQAFKIFKGVKASKQITLSQKDRDLEHFQSALRIMANASAQALPDHRVHSDKILQTKQGLSSRIIFNQYVDSATSWHSMYEIFAWAKLFGKAQDIQIIVYTHQRR